MCNRSSTALSQMDPLQGWEPELTQHSPDSVEFVSESTFFPTQLQAEETARAPPSPFSPTSNHTLICQVEWSDAETESSEDVIQNVPIGHYRAPIKCKSCDAVNTTVTSKDSLIKLSILSYELFTKPL